MKIVGVLGILAALMLGPIDVRDGEVKSTLSSPAVGAAVGRSSERPATAAGVSSPPISVRASASAVSEPPSFEVPEQGDVPFDASARPQWGGRIGGIDARGNLEVGLRGDSRAWTTIAKDVRSFQLLDWSLAVLKSDGTLLQQEGALDAPLTEIGRGVCGYQLTLTRTGILGCDHTFSVREMGSAARKVAAGVRAFQIDGDRAAVLGYDGTLWGQRGGEVRGFERIAANVRGFQIDRDWLAYVQETPPDAGMTPSNRLLAGPWEDGRAPFVEEYGRNVADFEMEAAIDPGPGFRTLLRLAVLAGDGSLSVAVGQAPPLERRALDRGPATSVAWAGERLAVLGSDRLRIAEIQRDGFTEGFVDVPGKTSQFRLSPEGALVVDRPDHSTELLRIAAADPDDGAELLAAKERSPQAALPSVESPGPDGAGVPLGMTQVAISSLRPRHLRRTVEGPPLEPRTCSVATSTASVRFSDDPELPAPASPSVAPEPAPLPGVAMPLVRTLSSSTAIPLYQLDLPGATDHFYTTSASSRSIAAGLGYLDQGTAAWVEPTQVSGTKPFWRFYMGGVRTDHFYTTSATEYTGVVNFGFVYEGIEGYIYTSQVAGTVPLYRLSWWIASGDGDHFYTTSASAKDAKLAQNWTFDGIEGYVWPSAPAPAGDDATVVSASVPGSIVANGSATASITMRNTGGTTWTFAGLYRLGSQNPPDNVTWGTGRVTLPASVPPGANVTFSVPMRAPATPGTFNFQWRMVHDGVAWFGAPTVNVPVSVTATANRAPVGYLDSVSTANFSVVGWAYDPDVPTQAITVHFDVDGTAAGDVVTDQSRPDVNSAFGLSGNHGFLWYLPAAFRSGTHTLRVYGVDTATGARTEVSLSPATYTVATTTYSISGNTGVAGATVSSGAFSAVSDANGDFTLASVPAATYTLQASKSGCLFYPASQYVTVGPSRSKIYFSSPCRLHYPRGITSFADAYIQAYSHASGTFTFSDPVMKPDNNGSCKATDDGRVTCRPNLPLWKSRQGSTICTSLLGKTVDSTHIRPRIGDYLPYGTDNYYWCSNCQTSGGIDPCAPYHVCTYLDFKNYIRIADPIGSRGGSIGCASPFQPYVGYWNGTASRNVFEGEITPDGWGLVPASADLKRWQTMVPGTHKVFANDAELGISMLSGDGYWTSEPIRMDPPPLLGGGNGPQCLAGNEECLTISSRAKASRFGDQWYITISGYMTADNIFQNTFDAVADLNSLAQIAQNGGTSASVNNQVAAVIQWMTDHSALDAILIGHSLGTMDALVIYQLGFSNGVLLYAVPGVVPDSALLETPSSAVSGARQVIGYGGIHDSIANVPELCNGSTNGCRIQLCSTTGRCQFFEVDTGSGFITIDNPHDRCRYQMRANPDATCW